MDAKLYYEQKCVELKRKVEKEKHTVRDEKRLGIGFFTFARKTDAQRYCMNANELSLTYLCSLVRMPIPSISIFHAEK